MQIGRKGISRTQPRSYFVDVSFFHPEYFHGENVRAGKNEGSFWTNQSNWLTKHVVGTLKLINQFYACSRESLLLYGKRALLELKECKPAPYP